MPGNYSTLISQIQNAIYTNNQKAITGNILQTQLLNMISALGAGYQWVGVATPTSPGTAQQPDFKCFYVATEPGTYQYLGSLQVAAGEVAFLYWDTAWHKLVPDIATATSVSQLGQKVDGIKITSTDVINGSVQGYTLVNYRLSNSGTWASPGKTLFIPVADIVKKLRIVPVLPAAGSYKYALVKSTSVSSGSSADYCTGESVHIVTGSEAIIEKDSLPQDCVYVAVVYKQTNNDPYAVDYVVIRDSMDNRIEDIEESVESVAREEITFAEAAAGGAGKVVNMRISDSGTWTTNNNPVSVFVPATSFESLRIIPNYSEEYSYKYAFVASDSTSGTSPDYCAGTGVVRLFRNEDTLILKNELPASCAYVLICIKQIAAEGEAVSKISINNVYDSINYLIEESKGLRSTGSSPYSGDRINLRGFTTQKVGAAVMTDWITYNGQSLSGQGAAVYGNRAFRIHDTGVCEVFDITDYNNITKIATFALGSYGQTGNHANCAKFGQAVNDSGFPYLYVSGNNGKCYVEKVSESGSVLVQTITLSDNVAGNMIVGNDGKLWLFYGDNLGTTMYFYKFNLPDPTSGDVTIALSSALDSWTDANCAEFLAYYYQGGIIFGGRIYVLYGQSGSTNKRLMAVWDTSTHARTSSVDFTDAIASELEDCDIRKGVMLVFTNGSNGVDIVDD